MPTTAANALTKTAAPPVGATPPADEDVLTGAVALAVAEANSLSKTLTHVGGAAVRLSTEETRGPSASRELASTGFSAASQAMASEDSVG